MKLSFGKLTRVPRISLTPNHPYQRAFLAEVLLSVDIPE